ncbi:MAG: HAD family hydrolase [Pseudomonadota bacterium]|nr:HAD family hydrolase [Pseudomonadota bacterium]
MKHLDECISATPRKANSGQSPVRNVGIDIDGTITAAPRLFAEMIGRVRNVGGRVHIVSSRSPQARDDTVAELSSLGIAFDALHLLKPWAERKTPCSLERLDWYEQYLWQKVEYAQENDLSTFFDDDPKVVGLFLAYAPEVRIVRPPWDGRNVCLRAVLRSASEPIRPNEPLSD